MIGEVSSFERYFARSNISWLGLKVQIKVSWRSIPKSISGSRSFVNSKIANLLGEILLQSCRSCRGYSRDWIRDSTHQPPTGITKNVISCQTDHFNWAPFSATDLTPLPSIRVYPGIVWNYESSASHASPVKRSRKAGCIPLWGGFMRVFCD